VGSALMCNHGTNVWYATGKAKAVDSVYNSYPATCMILSRL